MARVAEPVLGPSDFSTPWCGMAQVHGRRTWREGQPGIRRPGPHAQVESSSEQWRDAAGSLPTFGIRLHRRLARMLIEAYDGTDFGPSRNGEGAAQAAAQSLRKCVRAMARRCGQFAYDWLPVPPMFCTHVHGKLM